MKFWFTSDTHFGHANIIKYCNRPFKTLEQMDSTLVQNWNARVKSEDIVFHLGDFCFKNSPGGKTGEGGQNKATFFETMLTGKMILLHGNHDHNNSAKTIIESMTIKHGGKTIFMQHRPDRLPNFFMEKIDLILCGHVHEKWEYREHKHIPVINVGVDVFKFYPVDISEIIERLAKHERIRKQKEKEYDLPGPE